MDLKVGDEAVRYSCERHLVQLWQKPILQDSRAFETAEYNMWEQIFLISLNPLYDIK